MQPKSIAISGLLTDLEVLWPTGFNARRLGGILAACRFRSAVLGRDPPIPRCDEHLDVAGNRIRRGASHRVER